MPVDYPNNEFTQMIEQVGHRNRTGVSGVASAAPLPTVQSADMGLVVDDPAQPLSPERKAELDRLAIEAGVVDERLPADVGGQYASLDEAVRAGRSVEVTRVSGTSIPAGTYASLVTPVVPRLPDFSRVQEIDLVDGVVVVDGMTFPIPAADLLEFKRYAVATARESIMDRLNEAEGLFVQPATAEDTNGGLATGDEAHEVQQRPDGGSPEPQG